MSDWHGIYYLGTFEHTGFFSKSLEQLSKFRVKREKKIKKGKKDDIIINILLENVYLKHHLLL